MINKQNVLGMDIGGTNTVFGIVDARGTIIASGSVKTAKYPNFDDYVDSVYESLNALKILHII